jgi:hypothetical protein
MRLPPRFCNSSISAFSADGLVTRPAGAESDPTSQHHGKHLFDQRRTRRTNVWPANQLYLGIPKVSHRTLEVSRLSDRIVVQKVDNLAGRRLDGFVALDRRLPPARNEEFDMVSGIAQFAGTAQCRDAPLPWTGGNNNSHRWEHIAHGSNLAAKPPQVTSWLRGQCERARWCGWPYSWNNRPNSCNTPPRDSRQD